MTAQWMGQSPPDTSGLTPPEGADGFPSGFNAMGHPVPMSRRANAYQHCKNMGCLDDAVIWVTINAMSNHLCRDNPYLAMQEGMRLVDLIGTYRLMAVLLTN